MCFSGSKRERNRLTQVARVALSVPRRRGVSCLQDYVTEVRFLLLSGDGTMAEKH